MRKTKIVCTLGPASDDPEVLRALLRNGTNVIRLNFSHGDHEEHGKRIAMVKQIREEMGLPVAILMDTKGSGAKGKGRN
jgi:pyruvate kinase